MSVKSVKSAPEKEPEVSVPQQLPLLPLRDVVVFPKVAVPLYVGRPFSVAALEHAAKNKNLVLLVSQRSPDTDEPEADDLFEVGCVARIVQHLQLADGSVKTLIEGQHRARIGALSRDKKTGLILAHWKKMESHSLPKKEVAMELVKNVNEQFSMLAQLQRSSIPSDATTMAASLSDFSRLIDFVAFSLPVNVSERQKMLEETAVNLRAEKLLQQITGQLEIGKIERKIRGRLKHQIDKSHREFYLNEKVKAIQKELGDEGQNDLNDLKQRVKKAGMSKQAREKCLSELRKLNQTSPMSAEAGVVRSYVETLLSLPWLKRSDSNCDLLSAREILDLDHYGLEKIKERILEYLAVHQRVAKPKGSILCLVGPPGVGKTSLGRSIARATRREFVRIALGGVRDEAEIRGHRRTYVASMPGRVLQGMIRAKVRNPVFMLDEIDKMGMDYRGDPASALLEVLDPEQNHTFVDHYAEIDYDLSEVMFITTSNTNNIPPALLDRLEIIPIPGYTETEKVVISKRHLIAKQHLENGIPEGKLVFGENVLREMIQLYTREAGVRQLERAISKICRKSVTAQAIKYARILAAQKLRAAAEAQPAADQQAQVEVLSPDDPDDLPPSDDDPPRVEQQEDDSDSDSSDRAEQQVAAADADASASDEQAKTEDETEDDGDISDHDSEEEQSAPARLEPPPFKGQKVSSALMRKFLSAPPYRYDRARKDDKVGQVTGLAWTSAGGDLLNIETIKMPGRGKIEHTGKLGEIMKESIKASYSLVRARAQNLGIDKDFRRKFDLHVHLPEGAIPKDGPSAGIGLVCAMVSALAELPVRADTALTGEITLRGEVLPVGGIKEKLLAALRGNIDRVILPEENRKDLLELPDEVKKGLEIILVKWIDEVFEYIFPDFAASKIKRDIKLAAAKVKVKKAPSGSIPPPRQSSVPVPKKPSSPSPN